MATASDIIRSFPRARPPLPPRYAEIYEREYILNRQGAVAMASLAQRAEAWMHRQVARRTGSPTLELGAGTLNHVPFEAETGAYDVVEPFAALYAERPERAQVRAFYGRLADVPADARYARIVSVAVLEHMDDLPRELARAGVLLAEGGVFQAGIPSEGGLAWWLGWRLTTGLSYWLRKRLDYGVLMRHEHLNTAAEIVTLVRYFFDEVSVRRFPLPLHHASLYAYVEARRPHPGRCRDLLTGE